MFIKIIIIFIVLLTIIWFFFGNYKKEKMTIINDEKIENSNQDRKEKTIPYNFIEASFHKDYMDVITAFNTFSSGYHQIFNPNNVPCKVMKNIDNEIVQKIVKNFIKQLNSNIKHDIPSFHQPNTGWDEIVPEQKVESGWEKVQRSLGLPGSLYNEPKMHTKIQLKNIYDITKYETENETRYICKIIISKQKVKDDLIFQCSFVMNSNALQEDIKTEYVVVEDIFVVGYLTNQGLGTDRSELDDFYYFDSLEKNNMITGERVVTELMNKNLIRNKIMQEKLERMDPEVQSHYRQLPSLNNYQSYQVTTDITDEIGR